MTKPKRFPFAWLVILFLSITLAQSISAIELPAGIEKALSGSAGPTKAFSEMPTDIPDNSIDSNLYRIGGGDGFQISILNLPSYEFYPVVNPDGSLYISEVGEIPLGGTTLKEAKKIIRLKMKKTLVKNYEVYVSLKHVKKVMVNVSGSISDPGSYQLSGALRLYDALKAANHSNKPSLTNCDLRNVKVKNNDTLKTYDLLRYLASGDVNQNPYIFPGDNILVQPLNKSILVNGAILEPNIGKLPLVIGEKLSELLEIIQTDSRADTTFVLLQRGNSPSKKILRNESTSIELENRDIITFPSQENLSHQDTIVITGEAFRPGTYSIIWGKTTVAEAIEIAGGATKEASFENSFIVRRNKKISNLESEKDGSGLKPILKSTSNLSAVRPEINSSLNDLTATNDYTIIEIKNPSSMVLENEDEIHIPKIEKYVYISGAVTNPGAYLYNAGMTRNEYVKKAGGFLAKADQINSYVLFHYHDIVVLRGNDQVRAGDIIVIPSSTENKRLSTLYLPIFQALATVMSLVLTIFIITK